jgi:hypothetical protein
VRWASETRLNVQRTLNDSFPSLRDYLVQNCSDPDPKNHRGFEQPLWQTLNMFLGEWLCLVILYAFKFVSGFRGWRKCEDFELWTVSLKAFLLFLLWQRSIGPTTVLFHRNWTLTRT